MVKFQAKEMENTLKNGAVKQVVNRTISSGPAAKGKGSDDAEPENEDLQELPAKSSANTSRTYLIDDDEEDEDESDLEDEEAWVEKDFENGDSSLDDDFIPNESEGDLLSLQDDDDDDDDFDDE